MDANSNGKDGRHPDAFDFRGQLRGLKGAVLRHKWVVLLTCALTVGLTYAYTKLFPPIYKAEVLIQMEPQVDLPRDTFYKDWNQFRKEDAESEIELVAIGPVLTDVINHYGLKYDDVYHPFLSHAAYLWQESWIGNQYRSIKHKFFPPEKPELDLTPEQIQFAKTLNDMKTGISIEAIGETRVGKLIVRGPTRKVSDVANKLIDTYLAHRLERHTSEARAANAALTAQLDQAGKALKEVEERQQKFYEEHHILFDFAKERSDIEEWAKIGLSLHESRAKIAHVEKRLAEVERQLAAEPAEIVSAATQQISAPKETVRGQILGVELTLIDARHKYRADSPEVLELEDTVQQLRTKRDTLDDLQMFAKTTVPNPLREALKEQRSSLAAELEGARAALANLQKSDAEYKTFTDTWAVRQVGARQFVREQQLAENKYNLLLEKQQIAAMSEITAATARPSLRVVEYAVPSEKPYWPKTKLFIAFAVIAGLGMGIGAAALKDAIDGRVRSHHVEQGRVPATFHTTVTLRKGTRADGRIQPNGHATGRARDTSRN